MIALIALTLACAVDALSTVALIRRGGSEAMSAWIIGTQPPPWRVWMVVFALPVLAGVAVVWLASPLAWLLYPLALWRAALAVRNQTLARA